MTAQPTDTTLLGYDSNMPGMTAPFVSKLREIMAADPTQGRDANGAWEQAWLKKVTPWDNIDVQPALKELIEETWGKTGVDLEGLVDSGKGRALVAGCGRGYDATYFASHGFNTWGVDLAATAVQVAKAHHAIGINAPTNVEFKNLDFFTFPLPLSPTTSLPEQFSLAYDYTFLCALPIELRTSWGTRYADLIKKGGVLVALMYPLHGDREGGPPYSLNPEIYQEVLGESFE